MIFTYSQWRILMELYMEIPEQMLKGMTLIVVGKEENLHLPEKAPKLSV
jgi:hypothetical protein